MNSVAAEFIARAVVIRTDGRLLVARQRGRGFVFLPGGHLEPGESAEQALVRELREELGVEAEIVGLVGTVENAYTDNGQQHREVNTIFATRVVGSPASREPHLEFLWAPVGEIARLDLRPRSVRGLVEVVAAMRR